MTELLEGVGRRLRLAWAVATAGVVVPLALAAAVALVGLSRLLPLAWPEPAAGLLVTGVVAATVGAAVALRVPEPVAARAADRGLGTNDVFATALEVGDDPFAELVRARARELAAGRRPADAVPVHLDPRVLAVVVALAAAVAALALLPNPQDAVRARIGAEGEALAAEAEALTEAAEALRADRGVTAAVAAARLEALAEDLRQASRVDDGEVALDRATADLAAAVTPEFLAEKAAAVGLERSLEAVPLAPAGPGGAADQLAAAAEGLAALEPGDQAALAERLADLAAAQAVGNPALAAALQTAASALADGDVRGAAAALGEGAGLQAGATASVAAQEAATAAGRAVASSHARLGTGAGRPAEAASAGAGPGEGAGQGAGPGVGAGAGAGEGTGPGAGSGASGEVGGSAAPTGSGRGGTGTPAGSGDNASVGLQEGATVYAPDGRGSDGEAMVAGGDQLDGRSEVVGRGDGATRRGGRLVPLAEAFPTYDAEATAALDQLSVPPSVRSLVRSYFDGLGGRR